MNSPIAMNPEIENLHSTLNFVCRQVSIIVFNHVNTVLLGISSPKCLAQAYFSTRWFLLAQNGLCIKVKLL